MAFDPTQPFEEVTEEAIKPAFDPAKPFDAVADAPANKPAFDPNKPFEEALKVPAFVPEKPNYTLYEKVMAPIGAGMWNAPDALANMVHYVDYLFYKPIDAVFGTKIADDYAQKMTANSAAMQERRQIAMETGGETWGQLGAGIGEQVPQLPVQLATGLGAVKLLQGVNSAIRASATFGAIQSASSSFSDNVQQRVASGADVHDAANAEIAPSLASGMITALTTRGFGATGIESVFKESGAHGVMQKFTQVLKEGGMEAAEEMTDELGQIMNDLINNQQVTPKQAFDRVAQAGIIASILGSGTAGIHEALAKTPEIRNTEAVAETVKPDAPMTAAVLQEAADADLAAATAVLEKPAIVPTTGPLTELEKTGLSTEDQAKLAATRSVAGPVLVDGDGKVIAEGTVGDTHATLGQEAVKTAADPDAVLAAMENDEQHKFKTSDGAVVDRAEAATVAKEAGQVGDEVTELHSQDLKPEPLSTASRLTDTDGTQWDVSEFGRKGTSFENGVVLRNVETGKERNVTKAQAEAMKRDRQPIAGLEPVPAPQTVVSPTIEPEQASSTLVTPELEALAPQTAAVVAQIPSPIGALPAVLPTKPIVEPAPPPKPYEIHPPKRTPEEQQAKVDQGTAAVRAEVERTGIMPGLAKIRGQTGNDAKVARALHEELTAELAAKYPPQPIPEGGKDQGNGTVEQGGKVVPYFTNDPATLAKQIDTGVIGTDPGTRLYVDDTLIDDDKVNPAIIVNYDQEAKQYYVESVKHPLGPVSKPGDLATALKAAEKPGTKAHQTVFVGGNVELQGVADKVGYTPEDHIGEALMANGFTFTENPLAPNLTEQDDTEGVAALPAGIVRPTSAEAGLSIRTLRKLRIIDPSQPINSSQPNAIGTMLSAIAKGETESSAWTRAIAKILLKSKIDFSNVQVILNNRPNTGTAGLYVPNADDITKGEIHINVGVSHPGGVMGTIFHEIFHHVTLAKIHPDYKRTKFEQKAYDNLVSLFDHASRAVYKMNFGVEGTEAEIAAWRDAQRDAKSEMGARPYYMFSGLTEFLTEPISNPKAAKVLSQIEGLPGLKTSNKVLNVLKQVHQWLKNMFVGEQVNNSVLNQAVDQIFNIASTPLSKIRGSDVDLTNQSRALSEAVISKMSRSQLEEEYIRQYGPDGPSLDTFSRQELKDALLPVSLKNAQIARNEAGPIGDRHYGWLDRNGKFYTVQAPSIHEDTAKEIIRDNPKLAKAFEVARTRNPDLAYGSQQAMSDFMQSQGFLRVADNIGTTYFEGSPTPAQIIILRDAAIEKKVRLVHDIIGSKGVLRENEIYNPEGYASPTDDPRRSTTALSGMLETVSPLVRTALKDTTYISSTNADDVAAVTRFMSENSELQLSQMADMLDSRNRFLGLSDEQIGIARVQIARAAERQAAQLADNIANRRPITDTYGRTLGISGEGQQLLVKQYNDLAIRQYEQAQIDISRSGSFLSRVGALLAKIYSPVTTMASYTKPVAEAQKKVLNNETGAQAIKAAFETAKGTAATAAVNKADKVLQMATGLKQDTFDFFESIFGQGSMATSNQFLSRFTQGTGLPVVTDISNTIAGQMVDAVVPPDAKVKQPTPALDILHAEVKKIVAAQIESLLPPAESADVATVAPALQQLIRDTDHAALVEQAFNQAREALLANDKVTAEQKAAIQGAKLDLGKLQSAQTIVNSFLNLKDLVHRNLLTREASRDALIHDLLDAAPHLTTEQSEAITKALTSAFDAASAKELQAQLKQLTRSKGSKITVASSHLEDYLKLSRFGAYTDAALYNQIVEANPGLKLPTYNAGLVARIEAESQRIMKMPEDSDLRATAIAKLNGDIAQAHLGNLRGFDQFKYVVGQIGPAIWQAGVLSGPPTQLVNAGATMVNVQKDAFFAAMGYSVVAAREGRTDQAAKFFLDGVMGWFNHGRARAEFGRALATGVSKFRSEKGEGASILERLSPTNPYGLGKWVLRLASASDGFNSTNANEMKQRMAMRWAMLKGGKDAASIDAAINNAFNPAQPVYDSIKAQVDAEEAAGHFVGDVKRNRSIRMNELLEKRREEFMPGIITEGRAAAEEWTFNGDPKGLSGLVFEGMLGGLARQFPVAKYFLSFMRTNANLVNTSLDFSPIGVARAFNFSPSRALGEHNRYRRADIERGSPEFYSKLGQGIAGTAAIGALGMLLLQGLKDEDDGKEPWFTIYGSGPRTAVERNELKEGSGFIPNSIKIKGQHLVFTDWPILNIALGALGTMADDHRFKRTDEQSKLENASKMALSVINVIMERRLLTSVSNLFTVLQNPDQRGINAFKSAVSGVVGGFTNPQALKWARNTLGMDSDGKVSTLDQSTTKGWLYSMMPASIGYDTPALNVLGDPIKEFPWVATTKRFADFDPIKEHPILTPLVNAGLLIPPPSKQVSVGTATDIIEMGRNPEVYREFTKYRGEALKKILTPAYVAKIVALPHDKAQEALSKDVNSTANDYARAKVLKDIMAGKLQVDERKPRKK